MIPPSSHRAGDSSAVDTEGMVKARFVRGGGGEEGGGDERVVVRDGAKDLSGKH